MKKLTFLLYLMSAGILSFAQQPKIQPASKEDTIKIKKAILDYVEGFYNSDGKRVANAVHPELAKRIIIKDDAGNGMVKNMGASELVFIAKKNKNANVLNPDAPFKATITIYDIAKSSATAKAVTNKFKFIDYVQLGQIDGEWKIVNVLWEYTQ